MLGLLSDLVAVEDVLFVIRSEGATAEIRSNGLGIRVRDRWINIGDNDGPCHMHVDSRLIRRAEFVTREKPERISFGVMFYDGDGHRALAGFFTRMYDGDGLLRDDRRRLYDVLCAKYGQRLEF